MIVPFPPLGGVKATLTVVALDTVAVPIVGAIVRVVEAVDALDGTDVPPELVAVIVNVYIVFGVNPDTVIGEDAPVPVKLPGLLVTVYVITPSPVGAVNTTLTEVELVGVAVTIVGAPGAVVTEVLDATDVPPGFVAVIVNVYCVFAVNPETLIGEFGPVAVKPPGLLIV